MILTQTGMTFLFSWKSHFGGQSTLYLRSHELRRNETQNGMDFILVILTEIKFETSMRFSCEQNLPKAKYVQTRWILRLMCICVWNSLRVWISYWSFWQKWNFISDDKISFKPWNEMPTHVHQNIGSFWHAAEMKCHVNRTCFYTGLKSQTGMSSVRLSCECTLI